MVNQLTLTTNNVKTLKKESMRDFQAELDKVDKRLDKIENDHLELIRKALMRTTNNWN